MADKEALMREYFRFRVQDPEKYLLFDRLESKLMADKAVPAVAGKTARHSCGKLLKSSPASFKPGIDEQKLAECAA
jgi:hypothetical protein